MCIKNSACYCHHMKPFIIHDKKENFKKYFSDRYLDDLYDFLLMAYTLIETENNSRFANDLSKLVQNFLLDTSEISINVNDEAVKKQFMDSYHEHLDELVTEKTRLCDNLKLLIADIEKFVFINIHDVGFHTLLKDVAVRDQDNTQDKSTSHCCTMI